jgi:hypothetical protein
MLQLPTYRAARAAIGDALQADCDFQEWWAGREHTANMISWFNGAIMIKVMLLQPSSAACERVFSMLKAIMGDQQQANAKQDYRTRRQPS